jgi:hypothetical protein
MRKGNFRLRFSLYRGASCSQSLLARYLNTNFQHMCACEHVSSLWLGCFWHWNNIIFAFLDDLGEPTRHGVHLLITWQRDYVYAREQLRKTEVSAAYLAAFSIVWQRSAAICTFTGACLYLSNVTHLYSNTSRFITWNWEIAFVTLETLNYWKLKYLQASQWPLGLI